MDWVRYNRAMHARIILDAEDTSKMFRSGKVKSKDVPAAKWARIRRNDEVFYKYYSGADDAAQEE